jgi:polyisoprenoid-binding protein YceI
MLAGDVTIRGTTKSVTFDVQGKRDGASLTATATANPSFKFGDFGMTAPSVPFRVVSLVDEIRLAVDLVATAAS